MNGKDRDPGSNVHPFPLTHNDLNDSRMETSQPIEGMAVIEFEGCTQVAKSPVRYTLRTPEETVYPGLVVISPGFAATKATMDPLGKALAQEGYSSVTFESPRKHHSAIESFRNPLELDVLALVGVEHDLRKQSKTLAYRQAIPRQQRPDLGKQILGNYSKSGIPGALHAEKRNVPLDMMVNLGAVGYGELQAHKVLLNAAPIAAEMCIEGLLAVTRRGFKMSPREIIHQASYFARVHTLPEMKKCFEMRVDESVERIRERGTFVASLVFGKDFYVAENPDSAELFDHYEIMPNLNHLAPIFRPYIIARKMAEIEQRRYPTALGA